MTERYHSLDALRAGAMVLGLVLHAGLVYTEPAIVANLLPGQDPFAPTGAVFALTVWIHLWRMPLFFLLAGFFAQMVLERGGASAFLKDRAIRVLATCLIFVAIHNALSSQAFGTLDHLWFIWVLWWLCAFAALMHAQGLTRHLRWIGMAFANLPRLLWLVPVVIVGSLTLRINTVEQIIPLHLLDPAPQGYLFCLVFFLGGQALWLHRALLKELAAPPVFLSALAAGTLGTWAILEIAARVGGDPSQLEGAIFVAIALAAGTASGLATLGTMLGLLGLAQRVITRENRVLSWLVRLAYPVYVFHLYVAITISVIVVESVPGIPQLFNIAATTIATFGVCVALYYLLVRFTPLDWLFAGWKTAWFKWPWNAKGRPERRPTA